MRKKAPEAQAKEKEAEISRCPRQIPRTGDISVWGPYNCSNFYILSVIIQWVLDEFVFSRSYPMGITEKQIDVLKEVEKGMTHANQSQRESCALLILSILTDLDVVEQERSHVWKSETLTALTGLGENETRLERASRRICNNLSGILSPLLFEAGPFGKVEGRFRQEILDPAVRLHQSLRSSSYEYDTRSIPVLDRLSPRQMLDQWDLKDADTWQKARGEEQVGQALYCLHPSVVRFRTKGADPIIVARPVIVVVSPRRERGLAARGPKDSSLSGITAPPAAFEPSPATDQIMSSLDRESSAQVNFAATTVVYMDSDSAPHSRSRRHSFHERRTSAHPITHDEEEVFESIRRHLPVSPQISHRKRYRPEHVSLYFERGRQSLSRPEEYQDVQSYTRGHYIR